VSQSLSHSVEGQDSLLPSCTVSELSSDVSFRDGNYGLYLDDTLFDGTSAWCPTFDNEPLCSPGPRKGGAVAFECVGLEVWGVGP
jgi:hypothetical protein